ncbi:alpha-amylase [Candidatus Enterococcus ferrettii]|uniref:Alpha-amylase n=1 Tax=Candidatus Enterococcus ferrettii TaxID=2815324 RepID=A0ABV0EQF4_9ENTE|nr:alpha-amylase [Enterococcus sp. 665A]MBO1340941.1 alpha-amylase [Enterococcus sp. 665A]
MKNETILQAFEWYLPADSKHWHRLSKKAEELKELGISAVWLPPAYKGSAGIDDVGYGTYDLYDLGEFDQKKTVPTKYGTKDEYLQCIQALKKYDMKVYADIVFDHFMGADEEETVQAVAYSFDDRTKPISDEKEIKAWTKFTFPGRKGKYNQYQWHWQNFSGVDYDARNKDHAIFNFAEKGWESQVDDENGNFDYLMGCNLDMKNPETVEQLDKWGNWYQALTDVDGYRLDAVKHIRFDLFVNWLLHRREEKHEELFVVGEYWTDELDKLHEYLDLSGNLVLLFDVPLHFNLYQAANSMGNFDMRGIFAGTLIETRPDWSVTFVDNHDTQKGQSLESWVEGWFKSHAYALTLLRNEGTPVVFWGDLYGSKNVEAVGSSLTTMMKLREQLTFGSQADYFDDPSIIGWTCTGNFESEHSGMAVILTNAGGGEKEMTISAIHKGETFVDILGNNEAKVLLGDNGQGVFPVNDGQVSVYVNEKLVQQLH